MRQRQYWFWVVLAVLSLNAPAIQAADVLVMDDLGHEVKLSATPNRIISLAPHLTEILYELGVSEKIVATVAYSDYPEAAKQIPRLGDAFSLSIESVIALSPDLILAWSTGGNSRTISRLRELGYPVYINESATLESIAHAIRQIGLMVNEPEQGERVAGVFEASLASVSHAAGADRTVFFQIADTQLYTVNNEHLIGQAISACGATNIYADVRISVPLVSLESLVVHQPDVIVVSMPLQDTESQWTSTWERLGWGDRVRRIDASLITRPGPRMALGVKRLCQAILSETRSID